MAKIGDLGSLRVGVELPIKDWNNNYKKITGDVKKYPKTTDKALGRAGKLWEKHAKTVKAASIGMVAFGTAAAVGFGMAVNEAATFQQSMVNTQAVAGATSEELKQLTGFAREMGKQTVFSAKESADAMVSLASAGQNTNEIMNSLKGTLDLAAATNSDLAFTSRTVASTLSQFGFAATESDRIANVFTATISASQATMDKLATSMSIVGPVAKAVGLSLEETAGILGGLFNAGLDASTAGTSLRQSLAQLLKPTDGAKEALARLNVETLDSQGKLRNLTGIIADLEKSGLGAADALAIFGVRAGPGMLALVSQGADSIRDLTKEITGTDKAAEIAALQVGTFQSQTKLLKSAISELKITIGDQLLPILTEYTTKLTGIINKKSDWAAENPKLTKTLVTLGGVASVAIIGLGGIGLAAPGIKALAPVATLVAGDIALLAGAASGATIKLTALGTAVATVGSIALAAGTSYWAYRRILAAANKEVDNNAIATRVALKNQRNLSRAIEDINIELRDYVDEGLDPATASLGDLDINIGKLNRVLGTNFIKTDNVKRVMTGLEKSLARTTKEVNKTVLSLVKLGPPEEGAAEKTKRLAGEMKTLEAEVGKLSATLLNLPSAVEMGTTEIQRQADEAVAILKQRTKFETDWITTNGIIQLGLVEKNVDERLTLLGDETKEERKIRIKAQKEDRKLRDKASKEPLFIPGTLTKRDTNEIIGRGKTIADATDDLQTKREAKNVLGLKKAIDNTDRFAKKQDNIAEGVARNTEKREAETLDKQKQRMAEWQNQWGATIGAVEGNFADLFASIIDPSIEVGWKNFFGRFKDIAIQTATDILANQTVKKLFELGDMFGKKAVPLSPGGGPLSGTISPSTGTAIGSISGKATLGSIASAAAPLGAAAIWLGVLGAMDRRQAERMAEAERKLEQTAQETGIPIDIARRARDEQAKLQHLGFTPEHRRLLGIGGFDPAFGPEGKAIGTVGGIKDLGLEASEASIFVPRRPEGTDRFGRPLAATTAMAPGRAGSTTFSGDINIVLDLSNVKDIRDLDSAEMERVVRDGMIPALESIGFRLVRSDNLMTA